MLPLILRSLSFKHPFGRFFTRFFTRSLPSKMPLTPWVPNRYPLARRSGHVDVYQSASQGIVSVKDPYQWLEDDNETDEWTTVQEAFTREYLDKNPDLEKLRNAFRDCLDYPKVRKHPKSSTYY